MYGFISYNLIVSMMFEHFRRCWNYQNVAIKIWDDFSIAFLNT